MYADLHCHSTASDGMLAPAALVERAHAQGVGVLALTDHDTLDGLAEARAAAERLGIELVSGIELSCTGWAPASWATSSSTGRPWRAPWRPCARPAPGSVWRIPATTTLLEPRGASW